MLFTRYNILLFRPSGERVGSFHAKGWLLPAGLGLLLLLLAGNVLLWRHFYPHAQDKQRLVQLVDTASRQMAAINDLSFRIIALKNDFAPINDFSTKLQVMLNLENAEDREVQNAAFSGQIPFLYGIDGRLVLARQAHDIQEQLVNDIHHLEVQQQQLLKELLLQRDNLRRIPSIWPTRGRFSSPFGYRKNPITRRVSFHKGIDISAPNGTAIRAPAAGKVTFAKWFSTYGKTVEISHGNGLKTRFAHMSHIDVKEGQNVKRGDVIGKVGNTGRSVASHLHYEVHKNNRPVNPMYYIMDG